MKIKVLIIFQSNCHILSQLFGDQWKSQELYRFTRKQLKMQENTEIMNEKVRLSEVDTTLCWQKDSKPEGRKSHPLEGSTHIPPQIK